MIQTIMPLEPLFLNGFKWLEICQKRQFLIREKQLVDKNCPGLMEQKQHQDPEDAEDAPGR